MCYLQISDYKEECSVSVKWSAVRFLKNFSFFFADLSFLLLYIGSCHFYKIKHIHKNMKLQEV